jgi:hypothetical protein
MCVVTPWLLKEAVRASAPRVVLQNGPAVNRFSCAAPGDLSRMAHQTYSLETIKAEVAKCRVLCANHHQKHTIQQFGYKKWLLED